MDYYRFSEIKHPEKIDNDYFDNNKCPLEEDQIEVIYTGLDWEEIQWGNSSICLNKEMTIEHLRSFKYYKK